MKRVFKKLTQFFVGILALLAVGFMQLQAQAAEDSCQVYHVIGVNGGEEVEAQGEKVPVEVFDCRIMARTSMRGEEPALRSFSKCVFDVEGQTFDLKSLKDIEFQNKASDSQSRTFMGLIQDKWSQTAKWTEGRHENQSGELNLIGQSGEVTLSLQFELVSDSTCAQEVVRSHNKDSVGI